MPLPVLLNIRQPPLNKDTLLLQLPVQPTHLPYAYQNTTFHLSLTILAKIWSYHKLFITDIWLILLFFSN
jgi:hypothetical protein